MQDNRIYVENEDRTFETRLQFIRDIFSDKYAGEIIMASCIKHKLGVTYEQYNIDLHASELNLAGRDPLTVLKKLK